MFCVAAMCFRRKFYFGDSKMASCCEDNCALEKLREKQRGTLKAVLIINSVMFAVIVWSAIYGKSTALLSDSLDNLGDALTYGLSLYAVSQGTKAKAKVALFKGSLIFIGACGVWRRSFNGLLSPSYRLTRSWAFSVWLAWRQTRYVCCYCGSTETKTLT